MFAINVTPNPRRPDDNFLLRDLEHFTVHIWTRIAEAEKALARLNDDRCSITKDIPPAALERSTKRKLLMRRA